MIIIIPSLKTLPPPPSEKTGWPWTEESEPIPEKMPDGKPWPKISIVTPSYNQGQFIEETIRSVLLQNYPNLEYIIIDGGSTDNSVEIIKKYETWLTYWASEKDKGQAHAINKGFRKATGSIYAYLNSDDFFLPNALYIVGEYFMRRVNEKLIVNFSGNEMAENGDRIYRPAQVFHPELTNWLSSESSLLQQTTFWTKKLHEKIKWFREDLEFCFDKDFFLKAIFKYGEFAGCKEFELGTFRHHSDAKTSKLTHIMWKENAILWEFYKKDPYFARILKREQAERRSANHLQACFNTIGFIESSKHLFHAAFLYPNHVKTRFYLGAWKKIFYRFIKRVLSG